MPQKPDVVLPCVPHSVGVLKSSLSLLSSDCRYYVEGCSVVVVALRVVVVAVALLVVVAAVMMGSGDGGGGGLTNAPRGDERARCKALSTPHPSQ
eukprot:357001-Chlamydomonas_euryale.AAC.9